jgi:hypothetical protein
MTEVTGPRVEVVKDPKWQNRAAVEASARMFKERNGNINEGDEPNKEFVPKKSTLRLLANITEIPVEVQKRLGIENSRNVPRSRNPVDGGNGSNEANRAGLKQNEKVMWQRIVFESAELVEWLTSPPQDKDFEGLEAEAVHEWGDRRYWGGNKWWGDVETYCKAKGKDVATFLPPAKRDLSKNEMPCDAKMWLNEGILDREVTLSLGKIKRATDGEIKFDVIAANSTTSGDNGKRQFPKVEGIDLRWVEAVAGEVLQNGGVDKTRIDAIKEEKSLVLLRNAIKQAVLDMGIVDKGTDVSADIDQRIQKLWQERVGIDDALNGRLFEGKSISGDKDQDGVEWELGSLVVINGEVGIGVKRQNLNGGNLYFLSLDEQNKLILEQFGNEDGSIKMGGEVALANGLGMIVEGDRWQTVGAIRKEIGEKGGNSIEIETGTPLDGKYMVKVDGYEVIVSGEDYKILNPDQQVWLRQVMSLVKGKSGLNDDRVEIATDPDLYEMMDINSNLVKVEDGEHVGLSRAIIEARRQQKRSELKNLLKVLKNEGADTADVLTALAAADTGKIDGQSKLRVIGYEFNQGRELEIVAKMRTNDGRDKEYTMTVIGNNAVGGNVEYKRIDVEQQDVIKKVPKKGLVRFIPFIGFEKKTVKEPTSKPRDVGDFEKATLIKTLNMGGQLDGGEFDRKMIQEINENLARGGVVMVRNLINGEVAVKGAKGNLVFGRDKQKPDEIIWEAVERGRKTDEKSFVISKGEMAVLMKNMRVEDWPISLDQNKDRQLWDLYEQRKTHYEDVVAREEEIEVRRTKAERLIKQEFDPDRRQELEELFQEARFISKPKANAP